MVSALAPWQDCIGASMRFLSMWLGTMTIIIQSRLIIVRLNLTSCSVSSLMITKWLIMSESEKFSNHTFRNPKTIIFIKNWVLNHCFLWDSIMPPFWLLHTSLLNLLQLLVNSVCLFDLFIETALIRSALLHTFPPF